MPLTEKQMKIARVAEPRDKITGEDFKELRKASGGIVKFNEGGEVTSTEPRIIELEEIAEFGSEDAAEIAKSDLFKERGTKRLDKSVRVFSEGGRTSSDQDQDQADKKRAENKKLRGLGEGSKDLSNQEPAKKLFSKGMSVDASGMARGCGAVVRGKKFSGTF